MVPPFRPTLHLLIGAWRSLVARTVRVGEVPGSNPGAPMSRRPAKEANEGEKLAVASFAGFRSGTFGPVRRLSKQIHRNCAANPPQRGKREMLFDPDRVGDRSEARAARSTRRETTTRSAEMPFGAEGQSLGPVAFSAAGQGER